VVITDEHGVAYSDNMKRLLWSNPSFDETEYDVPDGVETICSFVLLIASVS